MTHETTASDVADYLLWLAHEHGSFVSNLKLQKLLYYAQGWHLGLFGRPLFADRFEAWVHGPVIPALYRKYRGYGWRNIDADAAPPTLPSETAVFLHEVAREYLPLDAYELELMSHREDPWRNARGRLAPDEPSSALLSESDMRAWFARAAASAPA